MAGRDAHLSELQSYRRSCFSSKLTCSCSLNLAQAALASGRRIAAQRCGCKHLKMKLEQGGQMLGEIRPIVTAGIEMEFVRDVTRLEQLVQRLGASVEAIVILRPTIKVNVQSGKIRGVDDRERVVLFPEGGVDGRTENAAKNSYPGELVGIDGVDDR